MRWRPYFLLAVLKIEEKDQQQVVCLIRVSLCRTEGSKQLCVCVHVCEMCMCTGADEHICASVSQISQVVTWYMICLFHCMLWLDASSCVCVFVCNRCFFLSDHYFLIVSEYVFGCYGVSQGDERRSEQRALIRSDCVWLGSAVCRGWRTQRGCRGEK